MTSVELFAGAGGLAMGVTKAGFHHEAVIEWDRDACATIRENQCRGERLVSRWPLIEGDVRDVDFTTYDKIDLVAGGPPCQPFSLGGKHRGPLDTRDMFPQAVRAVRETRPQAFMFENVRGLLRTSFAHYFGYIILQLTHPELTRMESEDWVDHRARLERHQTAGRFADLHYNVVFQLVNAANYGVPQKRERVFIIGFRSDLGREWSFPKPTHSADALLWDQWVTGEYWERHRIPKLSRPAMDPKLLGRVARISNLIEAPSQAPWLTVRDAISDLPDPECFPDGNGVMNHRLNPGARQYPGHTGSLLDEPAKTLKAGDHGVPGGENMLVRKDGSVRYFTVRESARLQTFPDDYFFRGSWSEAMRQLGNAVPMQLGERMAFSVRGCLE